MEACVYRVQAIDKNCNFWNIFVFANVGYKKYLAREYMGKMCQKYLNMYLFWCSSDQKMICSYHLGQGLLSQHALGHLP
jgi:hypothetical protein